MVAMDEVSGAIGGGEESCRYEMEWGGAIGGGGGKESYRNQLIDSRDYIKTFFVSNLPCL